MPQFHQASVYIADNSSESALRQINEALKFKNMYIRSAQISISTVLSVQMGLGFSLLNFLVSFSCRFSLP